MKIKQTVDLIFYNIEKADSCEYCEKIAKYVCTCTASNIRFCSEHQDLHLATPGKHIINLYKNDHVIPNASSKLLIIKKNH